MPRYQMLNNVEHRDVGIVMERSPETGDAVQYVMTFPLEFRRAQGTYPIFFQKDGTTGQFFPILLLGFETGENLFLGPGGWTPEYVPMSVLRGPFLIGYQEAPDHPDGKQAVITIDTESPLVTTADQGQRLFLEHGGASEYMENLTNLLEDIQLGLEQNADFIAVLTDNDLIESVTMSVTLNDGAERQLVGMYTINEDRLNELDTDTLAALHRDKHLQSIYMILASQSQFAKMVDMRNAQLPLAAANAG